jgi:hypothetical protein
VGAFGVGPMLAHPLHCGLFVLGVHLDAVEASALGPVVAFGGRGGLRFLLFDA